MAHLKLIFPGVSNSNAIGNLLCPHSALTSLLYQPEEQANEKIIEQPKPQIDTSRKTKARWTSSINQAKAFFCKIKEKIHNLRFVTDIDSSDYWSSEEKDNRFVHALELLEDDYTFSDI